MKKDGQFSTKHLIKHFYNTEEGKASWFPHKAETIKLYYKPNKQRGTEASDFPYSLSNDK